MDGSWSTEAQNLESHDRVANKHRHAMDACDLAVTALMEGRDQLPSLRRAFEFESQAAREWARLGGGQPWRGVLFRSAAAIATEAGMTVEAKEMAIEGLKDGPARQEQIELEGVLKAVTALD
jgi:hypothetical protein